MFFCEKCRYLFNVTKDIKSKQIGGRINETLSNIFSKYKSNETLTNRDLRKIKGKDLLEDERFENMTKKEQRKLMSIIKSVDKNFFAKGEEETSPKIGSTLAFFICKYCKNSNPIQPQTIIYSKKFSGGEGVTEAEDYTYAIYDLTLPRTRNYICKNRKCPTHKDDDVKEAVLIKDSTDQIKYLCTACSTNWISSV